MNFRICEFSQQPEGRTFHILQHTLFALCSFLTHLEPIKQPDMKGIKSSNKKASNSTVSGLVPDANIDLKGLLRRMKRSGTRGTAANLLRQVIDSDLGERFGWS